jgi:hypothetical protein
MKPTLFNKVFIGLTLFLTLFYAFWLGMDVKAGDSKEAIADGVLLGFWLFAFIFFSAMTAFERKMDRELEESRKDLDKAMDDLLGHVKKDIDHKHRIHEAMHEALETIGADRPPKPSEYKKVEDKFHELTGDHYLKLTAEKGDKRPSAKVSDQAVRRSQSQKSTC